LTLTIKKKTLHKICRFPSFGLGNKTKTSLNFFFIDDRRASCWLEIRGGRCENDVKTPVTKAECCGSIGKAWGSPCEKCPAPGRYKTDHKMFPSVILF
jgi:hypothetical protein